jgi:hypothetical protein
MPRLDVVLVYDLIKEAFGGPYIGDSHSPPYTVVDARCRVLVVGSIFPLTQLGNFENAWVRLTRRLDFIFLATLDGEGLRVDRACGPMLLCFADQWRCEIGDDPHTTPVCAGG